MITAGANANDYVNKRPLFALDFTMNDLLAVGGIGIEGAVRDDGKDVVEGEAVLLVEG